MLKQKTEKERIERVCKELTSICGIGIDFSKPENFVKLMETYVWLEDEDGDKEEFSIGTIVVGIDGFHRVSGFIADLYYILKRELGHDYFRKVKRDLTKEDVEIIKDGVNSAVYCYIKKAEPMTDSNTKDKCVNITELCDIYVDFSKPENFAKLLNTEVGDKTIGNIVSSNYEFKDTVTFLENLESLIDRFEPHTLTDKERKQIQSAISEREWVL